MTLHFHQKKHTLNFKFKAGTSRGSLTSRDSYYVFLTDKQQGIQGIGEASPLKLLSIDDRDDLAALIQEFGLHFINIPVPTQAKEIYELVATTVPPELPSLRFAFETALLDLLNGGKRILFNNNFSHAQAPIPINGLIWMGDEKFMMDQVQAKLDAGFNCIKMKIGAIDFEKELAILSFIRSRYTKEQITLRVDANGAFTAAEAPDKLRRLAALDIHSIEQPIQAGQLMAMGDLCQQQILPIALDEELIGISGRKDKLNLLEAIRPQYIILKPTLLGGFLSTMEWIEVAALLGIGWWITSALESNIGLNAICQFTAQYPVQLPQGLGTGQLYTNNIESPLEVRRGQIFYNLEQQWGCL
ncbi:o-succinylbenzoate synthase [Fulvivirgaceae bacterium BMA12]|uniref:O-succinylbenzoate synthase n=1 Tax=Agaribacillus aureus TaxID=3051825 RepID=A0ABT8L8X4_9BACT|nr:o-succinylbenzoate synthase [Fulvivirgaceae bacterium BMA12]